MADVLSDKLDPRCIELDLKGKRKGELIREMAEVLSRGGDIQDIESLTEKILEREKLSTTGIGSGIAIPHCMSPQVSQTTIAFGRKKGGAKFDAVDNQPVTLFFLLVGPEGDYAGHMQVLSKIARYLHDPRFCNELLSADSAEAVMTAFKGKEKV
jgi:fructose-specific phosphotransferase system IIA component